MAKFDCIPVLVDENQEIVLKPGQRAKVTFKGNTIIEGLVDYIINDEIGFDCDVVVQFKDIEDVEVLQ